MKIGICRKTFLFAETFDLSVFQQKQLDPADPKSAFAVFENFLYKLEALYPVGMNYPVSVTVFDDFIRRNRPARAGFSAIFDRIAVFTAFLAENKLIIFQIIPAFRFSVFVFRQETDPAFA